MNPPKLILCCKDALSHKDDILWLEENRWMTGTYDIRESQDGPCVLAAGGAHLNLAWIPERVFRIVK